MKPFRRRVRSFTWLALFAAFWLALAPSASHALASRGAGGGFNPWVEICSADGNRVGNDPATAHRVPGAGAVSSQAPAQAHIAQLDHCPMCGHGGTIVPLWPAVEAPLAAPEGADFIPALFAHAPRPLFAWLAARPRGPPAVS